MATHSSILSWRLPWTQELDVPQTPGSQGVRHNWVTNPLDSHEIIRNSSETVCVYPLPDFSQRVAKPYDFIRMLLLLSRKVGSDSSVTPWTVAQEAPLLMWFSKQEYRSKLPSPFSRASSRPRDRSRPSCTARQVLYHWATTEVHGQDVVLQ